MPRPLYTNNAQTTLATGIASTDTTIQVASGSGSLFPSPSNGDYFYITLVSVSLPTVEIVQCTARSGDVLTVVRGAEGTSPQPFSIGDGVQLRITAAGMNFLVGVSGATTQEQSFTATQGQTVFNLTNVSYTPNTNSLAVYVNGSKQVSGVNYTETSVNSFTLTSGANAGDIVEAVSGFSASNGTLYATGVKYNEGSTNAVNRTVQSKLQEILSPLDFGAIGDGVTDDTTAITNMVAALVSNGGGTVYLNGKTYYMGAGIVDFSALNNVTFIGPGGFKGPSVGVQGQATLGIKLYGTLGTALPYSSIISVTNGDTAFPFYVTNTFAPNQYLLLSNFPTDATDAYTNGIPDIFGNIPRNYANTSSSNLRQTRRKEILQVRSATSSQFICYWSTSYYYSVATTQFQVMTMPSNILFDNVTFTNVFMYNRYTNNVSFTSCKGFASNFFFETCVNNNVDFSNCDFQNTDSRVDFFGASRFFRITGVYKNNNTPSDNGMVKATGCTDYMVDLQAAGGLGVASYGFQADTNFSNDYQGYTDLGNLNYQIRVTAKDMNGGNAVSAFTDPYAKAYVSETTNGYGKIEVTADNCGVLLKGCADVNVYGNVYYQDNSTNSVYLYGTTSCGIFTTNLGNIFSTGTVSNPRGGQTQYNTDCRGFWLSWLSAPIIQGSTTAGTYTYNTNATTGEYYRIGNSVKLRGYITITGITTAGTGNLQIGNVPYTANSGTGQYGITNIPLWSYLTLTSGYTQVGGYVVPGQSPITLNQNGSSNSSAPLAINTAVAANTQLMFNAEIQV
jgi:hypothetical protein